MRSLSVCLGALITMALLVAVNTIGVAGEPTGGPSGDPAERPPVSFPLPDGGLFLDLPAEWESNSRLAAENAALGFLHPSGMELGEAIPMWILIERRPFTPDQSFDSLLHECLEEGKAREFSAQDSTTIKTADGGSLINYRFNPSEEDGAERALAFIETPDGAILFRQQADNAEIWGKHEDTINTILRSVRFLVKQEK